MRTFYPAEVESGLFGRAAVADIAVIGIPDAHWGEAVKAVVVLKQGGDATGAELIDYYRETIASYKTPNSIDFAESLPRNPSYEEPETHSSRPFNGNTVTR